MQNNKSAHIFIKTFNELRSTIFYPKQILTVPVKKDTAVFWTITAFVMLNPPLPVEPWGVCCFWFRFNNPLLLSILITKRTLGSLSWYWTIFHQCILPLSFLPTQQVMDLRNKLKMLSIISQKSSCLPTNPSSWGSACNVSCYTYCLLRIYGPWSQQNLLSQLSTMALHQIILLIPSNEGSVLFSPENSQLPLGLWFFQKNSLPYADQRATVNFIRIPFF